MYNILDQLDRQVLYYYTDSVIYVHRSGEYDPPLGDFLGELTNELESEEFIVEYLSAGPKNYAYHTNKGVEVGKVWGFSLNFTNSQLINFEAMRHLVLNPYVEEEEKKTITTTNPTKIYHDQL